MNESSLRVPHDGTIEILRGQVNGQPSMIIRPRTREDGGFRQPPKEIEFFAVMPDDVDLIVHSDRDGEHYESCISLGELRTWFSHYKLKP